MRTSLYKDDQPVPTIPRLALRPAEAAKLLGISEKHLWSLTSPNGLPAVKLGSRTAYFPHQILAWADRELVRQQQAAQQPAAECEVSK